MASGPRAGGPGSEDHPVAAAELAPRDLSRWELHAYALGARRTPQSVLSMDDNGELLFHARTAVTVDQLRERGIEASESQLALLEAYGLVTTDGAQITTAFPVIGPDVLSVLRSRIRQLAAELVPAIIAEVETISSDLRRRGNPDHGYAVLFGHALDGLLWDRLRTLALVPSTELSIQRPYWSGVFWAIYPPFDDSAGVNELVGSGATLVMVWTRDTEGALWKLGETEAVRELLGCPRSPNPLKVPVVVADVSDLRHRASMRIAETIAESLQHDSCDDLFASVSAANRQHRTVIVAHELIWSVMQTLVADGHVRRPAALQHSQAVTPRHLAEQVFVRVP